MFNIITRTSNRPNYFDRCYNSIHIYEDIYDINHIVIVDNKESYDYVSGYDNCTIVHIEEEHILEEIKNDIPNPNTGPSFIFNLYFNKALKQINNSDDWVLFLDDDDYYVDDVFALITKHEKIFDMIIWKMKYFDGRMLPDFSRGIKIGNIGSCCFAVRRHVIGDTKWDGWKCGDFRFIDQLKNRANQIKIRKQVFVGIATSGITGNYGKNKDLESGDDYAEVI